MRNILLLSSFILSFAVRAEETEVASTAKEVTLYHSGALVVRQVTLDLPAGSHELVFKNLSGKMLVNTLKFRNRELTILNRTLLRRYSHEEMTQMTDRRASLQEQIALLEQKFKANDFLKEVEDLERMMEFYSQKIISLKHELRAVEKEIKEAEGLQTMNWTNDAAAILKINVSVEKAFKGKAELQYVVGAVGWSPSYEIEVASKSAKSIRVKYMAKAMSQTGEDWKDVTLHLSSSYPLSSPTELPRATEAWKLSRNGSYRANNPEEAAPENENEPIARLEGVRYHNVNVPANIRTRTLSGKHTLKSNSTVFTFSILQTELPAHMYYYAYPVLDPDVYLAADVTNWDTLGLVDGLADINIMGNEVGRSTVRFSDFTDTLQLAIGKDNSIYVQRKEIPDQTYSKDVSLSKKIKERVATEFELHNHQTSSVPLVLIEQIPVSQVKSTDIDILKTSGGRVISSKGEVVWTLTLDPGKTLSKELVYEIEGGRRYTGSRYPARKTYRTISCPSF